MTEVSALAEELNRTERLRQQPVHNPDDLARHHFLTQLGYLQVDAVKAEQKGEYGHCAHCYAPIDPGRLEALPYATLCLPCERAAELAKRPKYATKYRRQE